VAPALVLLALLLPAVDTAPVDAVPVDAAPVDEGAVDVEDAPFEPHWPLLLLKTGPGLPLFVNARAEVFFLDGLSVEAGVSAPFLIPGSLTLGTRWRPRFLCAGCDGPLQARLGLGLEGTVFYNESFVPFSPPDTMLLLSPDAIVMWRVWERLGFTAGGRIGIGPTFGFAPFEASRIEPVVLFLIELGVVVF